MKTIFTTILFLGLFINSFGQKYYYYKPWKSFILESNKITFIIDSVKSDDGRDFLNKFVNQLSVHLNNLGYKCEVNNNTDATYDNNSLTIKLSLLKPAYVQLQALQGKIPLCNRVTFEQINSKTTKQIKTVINISVDKEEEAISPLTTDLAERISKQLTKK